MRRYITSAIWACIVLLVVVTIVQPVGLQAQFLFGICGVAAMMAVKMLKLKGMWRHMFLVIGSVIVLRYLYWRVTSTLPPVDELANFIPGLLLFMAELYSVSMLAINMTVVADPIKRKLEPLRGNQRDWPTVDIFVPTYNEDIQILGLTLAAARNLDYPTDKLNVFMLDDGGTDFRCFEHKDEKVRAEAIIRRRDFSAFCDELGVKYLTRAKNEHAKAGNMNEALKTTNGDIVVVFDADHAPSRDFLKKTIGYFQADPKLFLVQTPHQFLNPDPIEKNIESFDIMPSENEMFYSIIQQGLDKWNGSFFCGSAAVLRRKALNEVGGFAGITITEDCETAVELHALGWNSAFVNEPMIAGFQPETFSSFIGQRSRWCQGMLQILILKRPAFKSGLSMPQRLAYLSIMLNWLFPLSRLVFMVAPVCYIIFDLHIYNASFDEFIAFTVFAFAASAMMQSYIFGTVRWPWMSELYEYVQSWHLSRAIVSVVLKPSSPSFNVTNKAETLENDFFSDVGWFHFGMFFLLLATCLVGAYRLYLEGGTNELLYVIGFWAFFNFGIAAIGLGAVAERKQRRRHYRMPYAGGQVRAILELNGAKMPVSIHDIAIGGLMVIGKDKTLPARIAKGTVLKLHLVKGQRDTDPILHTFSVDLRWSDGDSDTTKFGLEFHKPTALDRRAQALLMFPNAEALARYKANRVTEQKLSSGTWYVMKLAVVQPIRGLRLAFQELGIMAKAKYKSKTAAPISTPEVAALAEPQVEASTTDIAVAESRSAGFEAVNPAAQLAEKAAEMREKSTQEAPLALPHAQAAIAHQLAPTFEMPIAQEATNLTPVHVERAHVAPQVIARAAPSPSASPTASPYSRPMPTESVAEAPSIAPIASDILDRKSGPTSAIGNQASSQSKIANPRSVPINFAPEDDRPKEDAPRSGQLQPREVPLSK